MEDEIYTKENALGDEFLKRLEETSRSFSNGTAKMYTWEETWQAAIDRVRASGK